MARLEVGGVGIGCRPWVGAVAPVAPVGGLNIASIVGRSAAPKGIERKSESRSNQVNFCSSDECLLETGRNGQEREKRAFDP